MSDVTPENPQIPPPPPPPAWQPPFPSTEPPGQGPAEPSGSYPLTPPEQTPARRSRLATAAAVTGGVVALAVGAFFVGQATAGGGGTSPGPGSTASAADAVNAVNAAASGGTPTAGPSSPAQCTMFNATAGTLKAVDGTTLTITDRSGKDVTVTTSSSTTIVKVESGTVGDIISGQVIGVHGTSSGQNAITADEIAILPSQKVPNLGQLPPGVGRLGQRLGLAFGTVKAVSGNTITVQEPDGTSVTVTTSSSTKVQKAATVQPKDLTVGQPIAATGTAGSNGSIAAKYVVQGSGDLGFKGFGLGGFHLGRLGPLGVPGLRGKAPEVPSPAAPPAAG